MIKNTRLLSLVVLSFIVILLASCSQNAENEHLPEYCQTYTGFMEIASPDLYQKMGGINQRNYLTVISEISIEWEADDPYKEIDLDGIQCFQNLTSLTLIGQSFKDISEISALKNIQQITLESTNVVDISSFKNLSKVKELNISNTKTLQSVDGVEEMTKLEALSLTHNGIVNIDGLNQLTKLTSLDLSNNEIVFFPSISNLEFLKTLNISNNQIEYLDDDLSGLRNLETLVASHNKISNIDSLDDLEKIQVLDLSFNDLGSGGGSPSFDSLDNATMLRELYLNDNGLTSISELEGKSLPLQILHLQNNELDDLSPIADYTTILDLQIYSNNISSIANLQGMENLTEINLSDNSIVDFSNLMSIPNLEFIYLYDNAITSIPDMDEAWPNLNTLDLTRNNVSDTSGVEGHPSLKVLKLAENNLVTLEGISNLENLETLELFYERDLDGNITEINPETEEPYQELNRNVIRVIRNSYNNVPKLVLDDDGTFDIGFSLEPNGEIYSSFIDLNDVTGVVLSNMQIDVIDEFSFTSTEIGGFILDGNNLTNIDFMKGNPALIYINVNGNPITSFDILNAETNDGDFANLQQFHGENNPVVVHFDNAFVDLENITLINFDNTSAGTITDSFTNLNQLIEFDLEGNSLTSIENSFNSIFSTHNIFNVIVFADGNLERVIDSFNVGVYEQIGIISQNPGTTETEISGSFNNLDVRNVTSIMISGAHFKTIDGSFNNCTVDNLSIMDSSIETISNSFVNLDVEVELNLQNNELQTLDLSSLLHIETLDISNNALTTVAFIDSLPGLQELDISNQQNTIDDTLSLSTIDGINNMPQLDTIILTGTGFTAIDGFKSIGITEFIYTLADNGGIQITSISSDSFSGNALVTMDLEGHVLSDISFLTTLSDIDELNISLDMVDITTFSSMPFAPTITTLILTNQQDILDYSIFSTYDDMETFSITSTETIINNFDGMERLQQITIGHEDNVVTINSSFNDLSFWNPSGFFVSNFDSLATINDSFDVYTNTVTILGSTTIIDSFNNAVGVIVNSDGELAPLFDTASFSSATSLTIVDPEYDSYLFLNDFTGLTGIAFNNITKNITDFRNDYISVVTFTAVTPAVSNLGITTNDTAQVVIAQSGSLPGGITVDSNSKTFQFDTQNRNIILNSTLSSPERLVLGGDVNNIEINNSDITLMEVNNFNAQASMTFNVDNLSSIDRTGLGFQAQDITVNTDSISVFFPLLANTITFNSPNLGNALLSGGIDQVDYVINTNQTTFSLQGDSRNMLFNAPNLTSFIGQGNGQVTQLTLDSDNLNDVTLNNRVYELILTTQVDTLNFVSGDTNDATITANSINSLSVEAVNADVLLNTTNNESVNLDLEIETLNLNAPNLPSMVFDGGSSINEADLGVLGSINDVTFNAATINSVTFETSQSIIDLSGLNIGTFNITGDNINDVTLDSPSSSLNLETLVATLDIDLNVDQFTLSNHANLATINVNAGSTINTISSSNFTLDEVNTFGADIETINITTTRPTIDIDGTNVEDIQLSGANLTNVTLEANSDIIINNSSGIVSYDLDATSTTLNVPSSTVTLSDTSSMTSLLINSTNALTMLDLGDASIVDVTVNDAALSFDVEATAITDFSYTGNTNNLGIDFPSNITPILNFNVNSGVQLDINTNEAMITSNDGLTITSSELEVVNIQAPGRIVNFNITGTDRQFTLDGDFSSAQFNAGNINDFVFDNSLDLNSLIILNNKMTTLDLTATTVATVGIVTTLSTLDYTDGPSTTETQINGTNLSSLTGTVNGLLSVTSNAATFNIDGTYSIVDISGIVPTIDIDGTYQEVELNVPNLSSLNLDQLTLVDLTINQNDLNTLDTLSLSDDAGDLNLEIGIDNFVLDTDFERVFLTVDSGYSVQIDTTQTTQYIETTSKELVLNAVGSVVTLNRSNNLDTITGSVERLDLYSSASGLITFDVDATRVNMNSITATSVNFTGTRTVDNISLFTDNVTLIDTDDVVINDLLADLDINAVVSVSTLADRAIINNVTQLNTLNVPVRIDGQTFSTNIRNVIFSTLNNSETTLLYTGASAGNIVANDFSQFALSAISATNLTLNSDQVANLTVQGPSLATLTLDVNSTNFNVLTPILTTLNVNTVDVSDTLTLATPFSNLIQVQDMLGTVQVLNMNSLSNAELVNIHQYLINTGIELNATNITNQSVYDFLYANNYAVSQSVEQTTNAKENTLLETASVNALAVIRTNIHFDHLTDSDIKDDLKADTMGTIQDIFDGYAASLGLTEQEMIDDDENYGQTFVDNAKSSIEATLNDTNAQIDFAQVAIDLEALIVQEATDDTNLEFANIGYTIIDQP